MCGEELPAVCGLLLLRGSPPRVRGGARAHGNKKRYGGDHPRVCGEEPGSLRCVSMRAGSPPRVRGGEARQGLACNEGRITPACAGRSQGYIRDVRVSEDHPRVCGEECPGAFVCFCFLGSPPRVRGGGHLVISVSERARITPACAGRSVRGVRLSGASADHPRVCGEESLPTKPSNFCGGSPPRVRGGGTRIPGCCSPRRITPACAGRSTPPQPPPGAWGGSPPRVRGGAGCWRESSSCRGITPACAGRSGCPARPGCPVRDHPRVCGEESERTSRKVVLPGSPPRVRGGERPALYRQLRRGITPACAGRRSSTSLMKRSR